jgi:hypothetical protein
MLLESWFISTLYTTRGLTNYFLDYHRFLARSTPFPKDDVTLEEHLPPVEKFIELARATQSWDPPMYVNAGATIGIGVPIGGGTREEVKVLATFMKPVATETVDPTSWRITDTDYRADKSFWINTPDTLKNYIEQNSLQASSFPAILPIKVMEYNVPSGATVWKHRQTGILGTNRLAVVKAVAKRRNLKTDAFLFAATTSVVTTLVIYWCWDDSYYSPKQQLRNYGRAMGLKV